MEASGPIPLAADGVQGATQVQDLVPELLGDPGHVVCSPVNARIHPLHPLQLACRGQAAGELRSGTEYAGTRNMTEHARMEARNDIGLWLSPSARGGGVLELAFEAGMG